MNQSQKFKSTKIEPIQTQLNSSVDYQRMAVNTQEQNSLYFGELEITRSGQGLPLGQENRKQLAFLAILRPFFAFLYYAFCCCLIAKLANRPTEDRGLLARFRHTLKSLKQKKFIDSEVFNALVTLYRHKVNAAAILSQVRLNPDFAYNREIRTDLEFFIPQICSFYLTNDLEPHEQRSVQDVLLRACEINFFFAHRVWFFMTASASY